MTRPIPKPDALTAPYWEQASEGVFALPLCEVCGLRHFYPRVACPHCGSERIAWAPASGRGRVYSFSVVHRAPGPAFAPDVPYVVAIIETEEGPHLMSRVVAIAPDAVAVGDRVRCRFERLEDGIGLPIFEPDPEVS